MVVEVSAVTGIPFRDLVSLDADTLHTYHDVLLKGGGRA